MGLDTSERTDGKRMICSRLGPVQNQSQKVCVYWQRGGCYRYPCRFLHPEGNPNPISTSAPCGSSSKWIRGGGGGGGNAVRTPPGKDKVCKYWLNGNCHYGDGCQYLHSWVGVESFAFLSLLEGHQKPIQGIAFPSGSYKLFSASKDGSVRIWDAETGKCYQNVDVGSEIGSMISNGPWIFIGCTNSIKVLNTENNNEYSLDGPFGLVYTLLTHQDMLFAGTQEGTVLVSRFNVVGNCFEPVASLKGHQKGVVSLIIGAQQLCSGSMDHTIKVWDLETFQCTQTLTDHTSVVTSLQFWNQFLLSGSLDKTIKIWATTTESGSLELTYTHNEEDGVISLHGLCNEQAKAVLLCACSNDNCVRLYDLPSFSKRGKLFTKEEVITMAPGPGGIFFTGGGNGEVRVWKCSFDN